MTIVLVGLSDGAECLATGASIALAHMTAEAGTVTTADATAQAGLAGAMVLELLLDLERQFRGAASRATRI